jgi:hydroxyethylthiazole kinase
MLQDIKKLIAQIRREKPLVLNLTNYVTMDFIANGLLSLGASPIMSVAEQEMAELLHISRVLIVNIGTLHDDFIKLCLTACRTANELKIPIVLDPVGVGASQYRTNTALALINDYELAIVRGNASEIMVLAGAAQKTKGVDTLAESQHAVDSAHILAKNYRLTVVVSGKTDWIVDAAQTRSFDRGSLLMPMITGSGCLLSAMTGAFHAVEKNPFDAAAAATLFYSLCGEAAAQKALSPGSFRTAFLDALHSVTV